MTVSARLGGLGCWGEALGGGGSLRAMLLASFSSLLVMSETEGSYWLLSPPGVPSQAFAGLLMSVSGVMVARQPVLF